MAFQETVQAMSARQIIMSMVNGLLNPATKVQMRTFGYYDPEQDKCFGCAATNTIAIIAGLSKVAAKDLGWYGFNPTSLDDCDRRFLDHFEYAIDSLRNGYIEGYNKYASIGGFAQITDNPNRVLPRLSTSNYRKNLTPYIALAQEQ